MKESFEFEDKFDKALLREISENEKKDATSPAIIPVIIQISKDSSVKKLQDLIMLRPEEKEGLNIINLKLMAAQLSIKSLRQLARLKDIEKIYCDYKVSTNLNIATAAVGANFTRNTFGLTGLNVGIAIVDTGIYPHPDFVTPINRIVHFKDFINGATAPYDDNGHGTHVAGCAAGNGSISGGLYTGVAPDASLIGVKVLDSSGGGSASTVIAGIDYVIQNKAQFNIKIMNLSLGGPPTLTYSDDPLARAAALAIDAGIFVVAAAGNNGAALSVDTPGIHPKVVTVGAIDDLNTASISDDVKAPYTSKSPTIDGLLKPDLFVPGSNITAAYSPNSTLGLQNPGAIVGGTYITLSGTSMATGICSGMAALILQAYPPFSPEKVKLTMLQSLQSFTSVREGYLLMQQIFKLLLS
ncbi:S8 family peptidase [Ectobacillus sp. JY-23]|uniref:S8 family peptidase n=1 Tax=Ectobacillus sp. JY-23 TaxID=2933872 RepID=UPI001FF0F13B|nr:S8 family peptidase [Ectobacillus sp. JY-23]UOY91299.1 S8 family peptidase [Ectobacillus sp. JY-23]